MSATVQDAAERRIVRWGDGRTGRLVSLPAKSRQRKRGRKAVVLLASGAFLSVDPDLIEVVA